MKALKLILLGAVAFPAFAAVLIGPWGALIVYEFHPLVCLLGAFAWTGALLGLLVWFTEKYPVRK